MGQLFPFCAYRYDTKRVGRIDDVVTQPYDKITAQTLGEYLRRHPCNIARLIKNQNYPKAAQYLEQWIHQGVLKQDASPAFYPYEQIFEFDGENCSRLGFIGLVSLENAEVAVKGHESILEKPLEDRLSLMRAIESNPELVFMLYRDSSPKVDQFLSDFKDRQEPVVEVVDEYQVTHRLWRLCETEGQGFIAEALRGAPFYIADGHHRFQTSLLFAKECVEKGWRKAGVESFDKRMIALFNMESPGLKILPTHRGVHQLSEFYLAELLLHLEPFFEIEKLDDLRQLDEAMKGKEHRIGLVVGLPPRIYVLKLIDGVENDPLFMPGVSGPTRQLDVHILHQGILRPFVGIGPAELASQKHVDYYRNREELVDRVWKGQYQVAFLLNPTTLEQVWQISERGEKMPQKSTDFYPKLVSGLVLMKMQIEK